MKQSLTILLSFLLIVGVLTLGKGCYDNSIKKEITTDLQAQTTTQEGEAIEKALQIDIDNSQLSDSAVDAGLSIDYRPERRPASQQSERMPSVPRNTPSTDRHHSHQAPSVQAQYPSPITLQRCQIKYGFNDNNEITQFETCEEE